MKLKIQQRPDHAEPSKMLGNKLQKGFKKDRFRLNLLKNNYELEMRQEKLGEVILL